MDNIYESNEESVFLPSENEYKPRDINIIDEAYDQYVACDKEPKVNLTVGVYRNDEGSSHIFDVVKNAEQQLLSGSERTKEYLDAEGLEVFRVAILDFILRDSRISPNDPRIKAIQTLSGTGALRLSLVALRSVSGCKEIYLPNHYYLFYDDIIQEADYSDLKYFRYYDKEENRLTFDEMIEDLKEANPRSVLMLNTCAQNPTGMDLSADQWNKLADLCREKQLIPILDTAYLGFVGGDPLADSFPIRIFLESEIEFLVTLSFSKCLGLYSDRVGCLIVFTSSESATSILHTRLCEIINASYMCPPKHGAEIVAKILSTPSLFRDWTSELRTIFDGIKKRRIDFYNALIKKNIPGDWSRILVQSGLFAYLNFSESQILYMRNVHCVFILKNGRLNVSGLNRKNIEQVAEAIWDTVVNFKDE